MWPIVSALGPLIVMLVVPLAIPLIGLILGTITDAVSPRRHTAAEDVVADAKARSAAWRAEMELRYGSHPSPVVPTPAHQSWWHRAA